MMTHGLPLANIKQFQSDPNFQVVVLPGISAINLWINSHKPNLTDPNVRKAIALALDRPTLINEVFGENAAVYNDLFAPGTLPPQYGFKTQYNLAQAKQIMANVPSDKRSIDLVYTSDDATNQQLAGLMAQQLDAAGFKVQLRGLPETEVFSFPTAPDSKKPDMIVLPQNPDDASPSSATQIDWLSAPGAGAFFPPLSPEADKVIQRAITSTSRGSGDGALRPSVADVRQAQCLCPDREHQDGGGGPQGHQRLLGVSPGALDCQPGGPQGVMRELQHQR